MKGNITDEMRETWFTRISFIKSRSNRLSDWELEFIDSINEMKDLSIKQSFKLGEIYRRLRDE